MLKKILSCLLLITVTVFAQRFLPDWQNAAIILPEKPNIVQGFAAEELQKHLALIGGVQLKIQRGGSAAFPLFVGTLPPGREQPLAPEEALWQISPQGCWFCGDDTPSSELKNRVPVAGVCRLQKLGTLTAVYDFLEQQFQVRWIEPGDGGIAFPAVTELSLQAGQGGWVPSIPKRGLRLGIAPFKSYNQDLPEAFQLTAEQWEKWNNEVSVWSKRMRMGSHLPMQYGHAFTTWWNKYGEQHPEYFAEVKGKRAPTRPKMPDTIKMCVSNPGLHRQIIENWLAGNPRSKFINVCENDWGDFCECTECRKLDMPPPPGKSWDYDLSDRYLYFANQVQKLAAEHDPEVTVCTYAYSVYRFPPRREKADPRLIIGFVPGMFAFEATDRMYKEWNAAGARQLFLRPNCQHSNTSLPMGFEKLMFDFFQLGVRNGIVGTDYDSIHHFWANTGISDYILARAHCYPDKTFAELEEEYYSAYGPAAADIREYYQYWRNEVWEKRLMPNRETIAERGRYGNFRRGLMWDLHKYYSEQDFELMDRILDRAAAREGLEAQVTARLQRLRLSNQHNLLLYKAITAPVEKKFTRSRELLTFRLANKDNLNLDWRTQLVSIERSFGDLAGTYAIWNFRDYADFQSMPEKWFFKIDSEDLGLKEKWELTPGGQITSTWEPIKITSGWEQQEGSGMHPKLLELLKEYDGIGYYGQTVKINPDWKGKEIALLFGAVDESCWVWVNGKAAGERIFKNSDDWKVPFAIRIDHCIDWEAPQQTVVVRVHDRGGQGGIWKPVAVVMK
ncbi:MAG: DUF4838 domain-containing protein [Lentisphaerae bacterium]|nr:DUF4838 domain-containing protein [Lentisphaerota bacterium]